MPQEKLNYNLMEAYIYTYVNKETGKTYIGSRSNYTGRAEDDFNIKYFSSSKDKQFLQDMHDGKLEGQIILKINCDNAKRKITFIEEEIIKKYWDKYGKELSYNHFACGKWNTGGMKLKPTPGMTGKHHTEETKEKMRRNNKRKRTGEIPWNKGLTKETDIRVKIGSEKLHEKLQTEKRIPWNKGKTHLTGEKNPMFGKHHTEEAKRKIGESNIKYVWINPTTKEERLMDTRRATRYLKGWIRK